MASLHLLTRRSGNLVAPGRNELVKSRIRMEGKRVKLAPEGEVVAHRGSVQRDAEGRAVLPSSDGSRTRDMRFRYAADTVAASEALQGLEGRVAGIVARARDGESGMGAAAGDAIKAARDTQGMRAHDTTFAALQTLKMFARFGLGADFSTLARYLQKHELVREHADYYAAQLELYGVLGDIDKARECLHKLTRRGVALGPPHYASVFTACSKHGAHGEAIAFKEFRSMRERGVPFDFGTALALLRCCGSVKRGRQVVRMMQSAGLNASSVAVYTTLAYTALQAHAPGLVISILDAASDDPKCTLDTPAQNLLMHALLLAADAADSPSGNDSRTLRLRVLATYAGMAAAADTTTYKHVAAACAGLSRHAGDACDEARGAAQVLQGGSGSVAHA